MKAYRKFVKSTFVVIIVLFFQIFVLTYWDIVRGKRLGDFRRSIKGVTKVLSEINKSTLSLQTIEVKISNFNDGKLILYSALATNSSENATWDIIVAQGWIEEKKKLGFGCCVIHNSGYIVNYKGTSKQIWGGFNNTFVKYGAIQFQCYIGGSHSNFGAPSKVAIYSIGGVAVQPCVKTLNNFVDIEFTYKWSGIAIFLKVLFGQLNYLDLLAWFEIHRSLGVNKVLGYVTDDLNEKARVVLGHYQRMGLFEALHYPMPLTDRDYSFHGDADPAFNYRGVSMLDGQVRLRGYEYLVFIDADEYLIPTQLNESFRDVFDRLFHRKPKAAEFSFETYIFVKNWEEEEKSPFSVGKYFSRTEETHDRVKHVVIPSRIEIGALRTHRIITKSKRYFAKTSDIALYHYRSFKSEWLNATTKFDDLTRIKDTRVYRLFKTLEGNIDRIRNIYGLW